MPRQPLRPGRAGSLLYVAAVYAVALGAAWLGFAACGSAGLSPPLGLALGLLAAMAVTYVATLHVDNGSVFDPYWSVLPPLAALHATGLSEQPALTPRQIAVHAVVWIWALRLTANWARGWPGLDHEDWRYAKLYRDWPLPRWAVQLVAVELVPALIVVAGCLALHPALALGDARFHLLDALALGVGLAAVGLEWVADEQMRAFARRRAPGQVMDRGLWRYSRHPNYLGEIGFWVALWLFAVSAAPAWWWTVVGPVAMIAMFLGVSIPMLDERSAERRPGFADYARRTRALLPGPPRRA